MKYVFVMFGALILVTALWTRAFAQPCRIVFDVCFDPAHDAIFSGNSFAGIAFIYPAWTITPSSAPIDCSTIAAAPIGTVYIQGAFVNSIPDSTPGDVAIVNFYFRPDNQTPIDAVGVVRYGDSYSITVLSSGLSLTHGEQAIVRNLAPNTVAFRFKIQ